MNCKDTVLTILEQRRGECVSGAELAREAGVSRNAVWKAVNTLNIEGMSIICVPHKGYKIETNSSGLSKQGIEKYLTACATIEVNKSLTSTNTRAKELAAQGASEGNVIIALKQVSGKGRQGRQFYSPENVGVYMSIILRPDSVVQAQYFTITAAVAVAHAIEQVGNKQAQIKWVNDVYVDGKKCCGILTEAASDMETGRLEYVIVGIGINVLEPQEGYPKQLQNIAGAVCPCGTPDARNRIAAAVINEYMRLYNLQDKQDVFDEYRRRSFLTGTRVIVLQGELEREATVCAIDEECRLVVSFDDGSVQALCSGEVRIISCKAR